MPDWCIEKTEGRRELATGPGNARWMLGEEIKFPSVPKPLVKEACPNDKSIPLRNKQTKKQTKQRLPRWQSMTQLLKQEKNCHKIRQGIICKLRIKYYPYWRHLGKGSKASEEEWVRTSEEESALEKMGVMTREDSAVKMALSTSRKTIAI